MQQEYEDSNNLWLFYLPKLMPTYFFDRRVIMGVKIGVIALSGLFVFPLLLLVLVQMRNFCHAKTTNERFSRRKPAPQSATFTESNSSDSMSGNLLGAEEDPESLKVQREVEEPKGN